MKLKGFIILAITGLVLALPGNLWAQSENYPEPDILLSKAKYGFVTLHTGGFGLGYVSGSYLDYFRFRYWEGNIVTMKHPKEVRSTNPYYPSGSSYAYGKLSSIIIPRVALGMHKMINDEPYWGGVEVGYTYKAGLSCAIAKPVYLVILHPTSDPTYYEKEVERYDPDLHYIDNIFGKASFLTGINELSFYPGAHAQAALTFEYGEFNESFRALEAGFSLDVFPRAVPIMAFNPPSWYMLSLYLSLELGKRYY